MAHSVVFGSYVSDGPGYAGRVEVVFSGATVRLQLDGREPLVAAIPGMSLPVVGSKPATEQDAKAIWPFCDGQTLEWLQGPAMIQADRLAWLALSDGGMAAVLLGGEPNLITLFDMRKTAGEGACVAMEM